MDSNRIKTLTHDTVCKMRTGMAQVTLPCEKREKMCKTWLGAAVRMSVERVKAEGLVEG